MPNPVLRSIPLLFLVLTFSFNQVAAQVKSGTEKARQQATEKPAPKSDFDKLVDEFFDGYFRFHPTSGTAAGFHQYDTQLEDYSKAAIEQEIAFAREFRDKFEKSNVAELSADTAADRQLVIDTNKSTLLELQDIRSWEKNPDRYSSGIANSVFVIMSRSFAPPAARLRSVIERERKMEKVFQAAHANLKNPPQIYTEVALEQLPGIVRFFQKDVPGAFKKVKDKKLLAEFRSANGSVIQQLQQYQSWLKNELLPQSKGDFRIGEANYRKKLLYEEMVDIPIERLLQIGNEDLRRNQQAFREVAAQIDPTRSPQEILEALEKEHPEPRKLLQAFRDVLGGLRRFIVSKHIVTIPSPVPPILEETPPFMRALTFAYMDTPGPYETKAKEAFFNVTLPEANWTAQHVAEHMAAFNRGTIISTAIHEAYPGHYVQFLWVQHANSKVRKLLGSGSNAEGWAHYCEQMMLDEGYGKTARHNGGPDISFLKLRLGQLQDALLRNARFIVGIELHAGKMKFDEGVDFFVKEGYQPRAVAERETKRGTSDPTYLVYTLGKLEIMKLREDYRKLRGDKFSLQEFHDNFLRQGFPPVKVIRRSLLGNDTPVL